MALRHYTQHSLLALLAFSLLSLTVGMILWEYLGVFLVFSFIIDLDNILCLFIFNKKYKKFYDQVINSLRKFDFKKTSEIATKNHKVLNNLVLHNIIFYIIVSLALVVVAILGQLLLTSIFLALFTHMTFDILDDQKQLGHINNWLWPVR